MIVVGGVMAVLLNLLIYHLWGLLGLLLNIVPFVRKPFDRAVEKVTAGYAAFLGPIVTRRIADDVGHRGLCRRHCPRDRACFRPASSRWRTRG